MGKVRARVPAKPVEDDEDLEDDELPPRPTRRRFLLGCLMRGGGCAGAGCLGAASFGGVLYFAVPWLFKTLVAGTIDYFFDRLERFVDHVRGREPRRRRSRKKTDVVEDQEE